MRKDPDPTITWERGRKARWQQRWINSVGVIIGMLLVAVTRYVLSNTAWGKSLPVGPVVRSSVVQLSVLPVLIFVIWAVRRLYRLENEGERTWLEGRVCRECGYARSDETVCPECGHRHRL